ncbi:bifunctional 5,10-methylenetetrahydrofolate dehydrogenase/5,10-methenyltetrahydrofolate cyclohydrolase [Candidatus Saccharibacteria bacterium]|nr:bifunctional 5,10-methylenetetrahydrofolate dehydrogenase/5,10-methenyltetrahydrofolate cyclohydrolase [Candidatus Saccharibacteria bacterium]
MKILSGKELAGFIKERQAHEVASLEVTPHLLIIRDSSDPVITKYVNLKIKYGEDIGVKVTDYVARDAENVKSKILAANDNPHVHGIILQLPIKDKAKTDEITSLIKPEKDVDGLSGKPGAFDSATATAIHWLLAGYDINLKGKKIAIIGRGKLVGAPLAKMWRESGYDVTIFHKGSDLTNLTNFDIIISATGQPGLILSSYVSPGAVLVDAGTASDKGVLKGDLADDLRSRQDLAAITPILGGVGPLTVTCLFDHVIQATKTI